MPCLVGCLALIAPRLAIVLVVIFSDYVGEAYRSVIWPLLGFLLMPLTTLAYAWAWHAGGGSISGIGLIVVVIAVLFDLGIIGGNASHERVRYYYVRPRV
jgi:hypothetical protein